MGKGKEQKRQQRGEEGRKIAEGRLAVTEN